MWQYYICIVHHSCIFSSDPHNSVFKVHKSHCFYPYFVEEEMGFRGRMVSPRLHMESVRFSSRRPFPSLELSRLGHSCSSAYWFLLFRTCIEFFFFVFQITGQAHVLLWSATRCARDSSVGLSAQKRSAVPPSAEPGATPVRCALPSPTPVAVASSQISAQELVKVNPSWCHY